MRIAFIIRSTLCDVPGGDTIQVLHTAKHLQESGVGVTIYLTNASIDYSRYDLLHFFNITRPSDILFHITKTNKPFVVSPILVDYSEYDRKYRKGFSGFLLQYFSADTNEYIEKNYSVIPNGIDTGIFQPDQSLSKNKMLVICAARIEGIKNQLNLIKALNNTSYTLMLIGSAAPNQKTYY